MGSCKKAETQSERCGRGHEHDAEQCKGLIGKLLRAYTTGDMLTMDYNQNRVNIETNAEGIIVGITFG